MDSTSPEMYRGTIASSTTVYGTPWSQDVSPVPISSVLSPPDRSPSVSMKAVVRFPAAALVPTTATFSAAGDYVLRAQVNDKSGDGGGGEQCCWTDALVKVTVK